jgi:uncharacterized delta-60 repeat protein
VVKSQAQANVAACGLLTFALAAALLAPALAQAAPGDLDPSFSGDGKVTTNFVGQHEDGASSVTIDPRGQIVAVGATAPSHQYSRYFALTRYRPNGRLDRSFSRNGKVKTRFGGDGADGRSVAIDFRGRMVVAGASCSPYPDCDFALARYRRNGWLDRSFSGGGKVTTDFQSGGANSVAIDSQGRIVVAGGTTESYAGGDFALARYMPNGALDPSFGAGGKVTTDFGDGHGATAVGIDSRGRIVAAGFRGGDFALARYKWNGALDTSFGADGKVTTDFGGVFDDANSVAIDSRDRIVAAGGRFTRERGDADFALARYWRNGRLDASFGGDGRVTTDLDPNSGTVRSVTIDSRRRIVAAGHRWKAYGDDQFALARYNPDGGLDRSFSRNGKVVKPDAVANSVTIDSRDRIVAAGSSRALRNSRFRLARYIGYRRR